MCGLIAILMGLLLPAIISVRARAIQSSCMSSLAQIHHGLQLYRTDFNDYLPRKSNGSDRGWSPHYAAAVARYMISERPLTWERISKIDALRCRTSSFPDASSTCIINALAFDADQPFLRPRFSHRWNRIAVNHDRLPLLLDSPPQGLGHCPETRLFSGWYADGLYVQDLQSLDKPEHLNPSARCNRAGHDAHGRGRCNVLFASGAVRSERLEDLPLPTFDDGVRELPRE